LQKIKLIIKNKIKNKCVTQEKSWLAKLDTWKQCGKVGSMPINRLSDPQKISMHSWLLFVFHSAEFLSLEASGPGGGPDWVTSSQNWKAIFILIYTFYPCKLQQHVIGFVQQAEDMGIKMSLFL